MSILWERWYHIIGGIIASVVAAVWWHHTRWQPPPQIHDLLPAIINIAAIAIGFLSAALAILFTISSSSIIFHLKDVDYFRFIVSYTISGIGWAFLLAAVCGGAVMVDPQKSHECYGVLLPLIIGLLFASGLAYFRVIRIFAAILRSKAKN